MKIDFMLARLVLSPVWSLDIGLEDLKVSIGFLGFGRGVA